MPNPSAAALAVFALASNLACTSFAPVSPVAIAPDARLRLSAPSGLVLVGATPDAPTLQLACPVSAVIARVTRVSGDSIVLANIDRRDLREGAPARCTGVLRGVLIVDPDAALSVQARRFDGGKTAALTVGVLMFIAISLHEIFSTPLRGPY